jgi:lysophospholipid acyltransferase (LPLAT)-like uncharacterized protein
MAFHRALLALAPRAASGFMRALHATMRWTTVGETAVLDLHRAGRPYVHAFFHDQLLLMTWSYRGGAFGRRLAVLASRHRDGEYIARTLERFGHQMVRGSTGRGGVSGLREMVRRLRSGADAAFAVDGPRGPRHVVQPGAIEAARLAAAPIVPVAFAASGKKNFIRGIASRSRARSRAAFSSTVSRSWSLPAPAAT